MSLYLIIAIGCLVAAAFFAFAESAAVAADRLSLSIRSRKGDKRARYLLQLLEPPSRLIMIALVSADLAVVIGSTSFSHWAGITFSPEIAGILSTFILTIVFFLFTELAPKAVGITYANQVSLSIVHPMRYLGWVLLPVTYVAQNIAREMLRLSGIKDNGKTTIISRQEVIMMLKDPRHSRVVPVEERNMIEQIMRLSETTIQSVMVPLVQIQALSEEETVKDAIELMLKHGLRRLPVYRERIDEIVGLVSTDDLLSSPMEQRLRAIMRQMVVLPETGSLEMALETLRTNEDHTAIVVDEFGGASGMVFLRDVLAEIVGEMQEGESGEGGDQETLEKEGRLSAQIAIKEAESVLGTKLPEGPYVTLGGLVIYNLGHLPEVGESVQVAGYKLTVLEATTRMILWLKVAQLVK